MLFSIECLLEVDRCHPTVRLPLSVFLEMSLYVVKWSVVLIFSVICLVGTLVPVKLGVKSVV